MLFSQFCSLIGKQIQSDSNSSSFYCLLNLSAPRNLFREIQSIHTTGLVHTHLSNQHKVTDVLAEVKTPQTANVSFADTKIVRFYILEYLNGGRAILM